jgi:hypothetical protein
MPAHTDQDQQDYRVVRLAGRPIIATPAKPLRLRLAGLRHYRPVTKKRACLRAALRFSAITGIDRMFAPACPSPFAPTDDFGFQPWLHEIRALLGAPSSLATVIWPQLVGRKRIYVHLMSPAGTPVAFCKIALDAHNAARLKNELDALSALGEGSLAVARIPRVLHHHATTDYRTVVYEPFPLDLVPLKHSWPELAPAVAEISGSVRRVVRAELEGFDWWRRFAERRSQYSGEFLRQIDEAVAGPVAVCRVQGDATPSNVFRSAAEIWICDWEFSSPSGPWRTDELSYYLAANHYQCLIRPVAALARCLQRFAPERDRDAIGALTLAMAFLCGRNEPRALELAQHWRLLSHAPARQPDPQFTQTSAPFRLS